MKENFSFLQHFTKYDRGKIIVLGNLNIYTSIIVTRN